MINSPSIVPDLDSWLDQMESAARDLMVVDHALITQDTRDFTANQIQMYQAIRDERERFISTGRKVRAGAKQGGETRLDCSIKEDALICADFVKRLKALSPGSKYTVTQAIKAIARIRKYGKDIPKPHSQSGVDGAIKRQCKRGGKNGVHNAGHCGLHVCHCAVIEEMRSHDRHRSNTKPNAICPGTTGSTDTHVDGWDEKTSRCR